MNNPNINYFDPEVLKEEAKVLYDLQKRKNDGRGIWCVRAIADYLHKGKFHLARQIRQLEGDTTRLHEDIENELRRFFGCRLHARHDCDHYLCNTKRFTPLR